MRVWRRMHWRWKVIGSVFVLLFLTWVASALYAQHVLKELIHEIKLNPNYQSRVIAWIGPATRRELAAMNGADDSISIRPLVSFGNGPSVTHTAFLKSGSKTLRLRLRFNPFEGKFHIVGFANE